MPMDRPIDFEGGRVTLIDANHCPGATARARVRVRVWVTVRVRVLVLGFEP